MKLTALRPILWTQNLEESLKFYSEVLGFTIAEYNPDWQWASLHHNEVEVMLSAFNQHSPQKESLFTGSFYFTVVDVENLWLDLKIKTKVCYPLETFDWGMREFAIYDPNGYILQFGEEI